MMATKSRNSTCLSTVFRIRKSGILGTLFGIILLVIIGRNLNLSLVLIEPSLTNRQTEHQQRFEETTDTRSITLESINSTTLKQPEMNETVPDADVVHKGKTKVLLQTYYRGGSSLLGAMFAQNPNAFYYFEPLHYIVPFAHETEGHNYLENFEKLDDGSLGPLPDPLIATRVDTVKKSLICDHKHMDYQALTSRFFLNGWSSPKFAAYVKCMSTIDHKNYMQCISQSEEPCSASDITAVKVLRYPIYLVPKLLQDLPDLKVVHYVRDPRGIMSSRMQIENYDQTGLEAASKFLCQEMAENYKTFMELQQQSEESKRHFLFLKYEDLGLDPNKTAHEMYDFINESFPDSLATWIKQNTEAKRPDTFEYGPYGMRRNSTKTIHKWRTLLNKAQIETITNVCHTTLNLLSYDE